MFCWGIVFLGSAIEGECVQEGCALGLRRDVWKMRSLRAQMRRRGEILSPGESAKGMNSPLKLAPLQTALRQ